MSSETPLMQQYQRIKAEHQGEILLFRMGDFYEMFQEDAVTGRACWVSRSLPVITAERRESRWPGCR